MKKTVSGEGIGGSVETGRRTVLAGFGIATLTAMAQGSLALAVPAGARRRFGFAAPDVPEGFLLDGKPFQIRSGEMHPCRIPRQHWLHRIRMAKAMGLNTIAIYVMWNYHEERQGQFDFKTGNRDIAAFIRLCAAEGMLVYLRPGPYVCAEWDLGGIPAWLLRDPNIRLRDGTDAKYMSAVARYIAHLAAVVRPLMMDQGGPIVMVQVENEYASFGKDLSYLSAIRKMWSDQGISGPFAISDGLSQIQEAGTYLPGTALGLDGDTDFAAARLISRGAPVWVGEGYPGWITHWGGPFAVGDYRKTLKMLMRERVSFNLYVVHGGTNFGWTAGANGGGGDEFLATITSYDYGAPINEHGAATAQYHDLRTIIHDAIGTTPLAIPATPAVTAFAPVKTRPAGSLWKSLPRPVRRVRPQPMETLLGQTTGMVLYRSTIPAGVQGELRIEELHDEALVLIDGRRLGSLSRVEAAKAAASLMIDASTKPRQLDILVYPYGRINYGHYMDVDRKGILGRVTVSSRELTDWQVFGLPLDAPHIARIRSAPSDGDGLLHEAAFTLSAARDTFIDMAGWGLGFVWVNGHLLGRHSPLGPQTRFYCPAEWLKAGRNQVTVLDLYAKSGRTVAGVLQSDTEAKVAKG